MKKVMLNNTQNQQLPSNQAKAIIHPPQHVYRLFKKNGQILHIQARSFVKQDNAIVFYQTVELINLNGDVIKEQRPALLVCLQDIDSIVTIQGVEGNWEQYIMQSAPPQITHQTANHTTLMDELKALKSIVETLIKNNAEQRIQIDLNVIGLNSTEYVNNQNAVSLTHVSEINKTDIDDFSNIKNINENHLENEFSQDDENNIISEKQYSIDNQNEFQDEGKAINLDDLNDFSIGDIPDLNSSNDYDFDNGPPLDLEINAPEAALPILDGDPNDFLMPQSQNDDDEEWEAAALAAQNSALDDVPLEVLEIMNSETNTNQSDLSETSQGQVAALEELEDLNLLQTQNKANNHNDELIALDYLMEELNNKVNGITHSKSQHDLELEKIEQEVLGVDTSQNVVESEFEDELEAHENKIIATRLKTYLESINRNGKSKFVLESFVSFLQTAEGLEEMTEDKAGGIICSLILNNKVNYKSFDDYQVQSALNYHKHDIDRLWVMDRNIVKLTNQIRMKFDSLRHRHISRIDMLVWLLKNGHMKLNG